MTVNDRPADARLRLYLYISVVLVHVQRFRHLFICIIFYFKQNKCFKSYKCGIIIKKEVL